MRYRVEFKKPPAQVFAARVWTVLLLSSGEYWLLQLRGDERAWPATDSDLKRMVQSFQLLEPMLTRVKTAKPAEASKPMPSILPEGKCPFGGTAFGMSAFLSCDWKVTGQWQGAADKDGRVGVERLERSSPHQSLYVQHHVGSWSTDEYSRKQELYLADKTKGAGEYNRTGKRDIVVDGIPGTLVSGWCSYSYDYTPPTIEYSGRPARATGEGATVFDSC